EGGVGTQQAHHVHGLLARLNALRALFPNFGQNLVRAGAGPLKAGLDVRVGRPEFNPFPQRDLGGSVTRCLVRCSSTRFGGNLKDTAISSCGTNVGQRMCWPIQTAGWRAGAQWETTA